MQAIRFVLFDAGNTLLHLDTAHIAARVTAHGRRATALDVQTAEYASKAMVERVLRTGNGAVRTQDLVWRNRQASYFGTLLEALGVAAPARAAILADLEAHNRERSLWRIVTPGTSEVLAELRRRGFRLAVVSNADGRMEADLVAAGLREHFEVVIDSHHVGVEKPDPAIFALALAPLAAQPAAALYLGDLFAIDVLGARRAGMTGMLLDPLGRYPVPVDCPRLRRLDELPALLPARAG